jgi:hypothetical protein
VDYPEYFDLRVKYPQNNLPTSIALVATAGEDVRMAGPIVSHWDRDLILQMRRLQVNIENVLRGDLPPGPAEIFYFTYGMSHDGNRVLGNWPPGERFLLFVRRDAGVLRMACDGVASCVTRVDAGVHPDLKADPAKPLQATLAEVFLSRGAGMSDAQFADVLEASVGRYSFICERQAGDHCDDYMRDRLLILGNDRNAPKTRARACQFLGEGFQLGCDGKKLPKPLPTKPEPPGNPCLLSEMLGLPCESRPK